MEKGTKEFIESLLINALDELQNLTGYEKATVSCQVAELMLKLEGYDVSENLIPQKRDLENKPSENPVEFKDLNEVAPIAETLNKTVEVATETTEEKHDEIIENSTKEEKPLPNDWETKILDSTELDDTWTDRMKANKDVYGYFIKLGTFIQKGIKSKVFDKDWVNQKASEVTEGRVKDITTDFKTAVTPKMVKMFCSYITDETRRLIDSKKKAA